MNLFKAASTVSLLTLASRITGLVREQLIAAAFGASAATDAFNVAFRIPNLLRRLFAEGAFSQAFVPILAAARERPQALASVGAKELFDWAAWKYPDLLGGSYIDFPAPIPYEGKLFTVRYVPGKSAYMGLDNQNQVYVLAPFTGNALQGFGPLSTFSPLIQADSCSVYPGLCGGSTSPPGPLNGCVMPAAQALAIGNRWALRYETTGDAVATTDLQTVVEAADTFEGQAAVRSLTTLTQVATIDGTQQSLTSTSRSYDQVASGGFVASLTRSLPCNHGRLFATPFTTFPLLCLAGRLAAS